jgi:hypothetical protein
LIIALFLLYLQKTTRHDRCDQKYQELIVELEQIKLFNSKLICVTKILSGFDLTKEEKVVLMKEFDNTQSVVEAENKYKEFIKSKQ